MAEEGIPDGLETDVKADIEHGSALAVLSSPMTTDSPGSTTIAAFQVTRDYPLVTLVSMFAPTPDWFTGVSGLSLLDENGNWVKSKVVLLYPFDAGTQQNLHYALHQPPGFGVRPRAQRFGLPQPGHGQQVGHRRLGRLRADQAANVRHLRLVDAEQDRGQHFDRGRSDRDGRIADVQSGCQRTSRSTR